MVDLYVYAYDIKRGSQTRIYKYIFNLINTWNPVSVQMERKFVTFWS